MTSVSGNLSLASHQLCAFEQVTQFNMLNATSDQLQYIQCECLRIHFSRAAEHTQKN